MIRDSIRHTKNGTDAIWLFEKYPEFLFNKWEDFRHPYPFQ